MIKLTECETGLQKHEYLQIKGDAPFLLSFYLFINLCFYYIFSHRCLKVNQKGKSFSSERNSVYKEASKS